MRDIQVDEDNDLVIAGDFVIDESDQQHIRHLFEAAPKDFRFDVLIGANVRAALNGGGARQEIIAACEKQLRKDGYQKAKVVLTGDAIEVKDAV